MALLIVVRYFHKRSANRFYTACPGIRYGILINLLLIFLYIATILGICFSPPKKQMVRRSKEAE